MTTPKVDAVVFPCDTFVAPTGSGHGLAPYRPCAACGFCENIHGLDGAQLLAMGLFDPTKETPGMESDPTRLAYLELERGLAEIEDAPTAEEVVRATINAPPQ